MLMQPKLCCVVNLIGRSWRTWKTNEIITPTHRQDGCNNLASLKVCPSPISTIVVLCVAVPQYRPYYLFAIVSFCNTTTSSQVLEHNILYHATFASNVHIFKRQEHNAIIRLKSIIQQFDRVINRAMIRYYQMCWPYKIHNKFHWHHEWNFMDWRCSTDSHN